VERVLWTFWVQNSILDWNIVLGLEKGKMLHVYVRVPFGAGRVDRSGCRSDYDIRLYFVQSRRSYRPQLLLANGGALYLWRRSLHNFVSHTQFVMIRGLSMDSPEQGRGRGFMQELIVLLLVLFVIGYGFAHMFGGKTTADHYARWCKRQLRGVFLWIMRLIGRGLQRLGRWIVRKATPRRRDGNPPKTAGNP